MTVPELDRVVTGDAVRVLGACREPFVHLTVTSPPYDDLRHYRGFEFSAETMLRAVLDVTVEGGVCVWVVGERILRGSRTLTSFEHALIGRDLGWRVHDVMIYQKRNTPFKRRGAYTNCYELMIVFSRGKPRTFNPLMERTVKSGIVTAPYSKGPDGVNRYRRVARNKEKVRNNIWPYSVGLYGSTADRIAFQHPAILPERLAEDHVLSWSNEGDVVLDPMCGSGTTCKAARRNGRRWLGIEVSPEYADIARRRVELA